MGNYSNLIVFFYINKGYVQPFINLIWVSYCKLCLDHLCLIMAPERDFVKLQLELHTGAHGGGEGSFGNFPTADGGENSLDIIYQFFIVK